MELRGDAGAPPSTPPPEWAFGPGVRRTRRVGVVRAGDWPVDDWWWGVGTRGAVANGTRRAPAAPPACARSRLFRRDLGRGLGICFVRRARITSVGFGRSALFSVRWIAVAFSMGCRRATVGIVRVRFVGGRFDWLDAGDGLRLGSNRRCGRYRWCGESRWCDVHRSDCRRCFSPGYEATQSLAGKLHPRAPDWGGVPRIAN